MTPSPDLPTPHTRPPRALQRIQRDEDAADLASARRRLSSYLRTRGDQGEFHADLIERLARINARMHDPAGAGQWYVLIDSQDEGARDAIERFETSMGRSDFEVWRSLPPWARNLPLDRYPPAARERLARVMPPYMKPRRPPQGPRGRGDTLATVISVGCLVIVMVVAIALLAIGGFTASRWVFG